MSLVLDGITGGTSVCFAQTALVLRREKPLAIFHLTTHDKGLLFSMYLFHYHLLVVGDERVIGLNRARIALIVKANTQRLAGLALGLS
jgi:hypothetical protein